MILSSNGVESGEDHHILDGCLASPARAGEFVLCLTIIRGFDPSTSLTTGYPSLQAAIASPRHVPEMSDRSPGTSRGKSADSPLKRAAGGATSRDAVLS